MLFRSLYFTEHADIKSSQAFDDILDGENLKEIYKAILTAVNDNPLADYKEIAKAIKQSPKKVKNALDTLTSDGAIEVSSVKGVDGKIPKKIISDKAQSYLDENPADIGAFSIMYSYEARPGLQKEIDGTRPFCHDLVEADLLYSREDIEAVSNEVGWDTFKYKIGRAHV